MLYCDVCFLGGVWNWTCRISEVCLCIYKSHVNCSMLQNVPELPREAVVNTVLIQLGHEYLLLPQIEVWRVAKETGASRNGTWFCGNLWRERWEKDLMSSSLLWLKCFCCSVPPATYGCVPLVSAAALFSVSMMLSRRCCKAPSEAWVVLVVGVDAELGVFCAGAEWRRVCVCVHVLIVGGVQGGVPPYLHLRDLLQWVRSGGVGISTQLSDSTPPLNITPHTSPLDCFRLTIMLG